MRSENLTSENLTIRRGKAADAALLTELARRTFDETFAEHNRAEDMQTYLAETFSEAKQERELTNPAITTLFAELDGVAVAYAQVKRGAAPPCVDREHALEIARFYVDRRHHGRGIAQQLMHAVDAIAIETGNSAVWLGVWERNARAIAFYKKFGFERVGAQTFVLGIHPLR